SMARCASVRSDFRPSFFQSRIIRFLPVMTSQNSQNAGGAMLEALQFSGSGTGTTMVAGRLLSGEKERWGGVT
ncbi:MAG: hypothetical protein ACK56Q_05320, partial [Pirellulaceae bacterium]